MSVKWEGGLTSLDVEDKNTMRGVDNLQDLAEGISLLFDAAIPLVQK